MPFDYGLRLNNRQRIANAREKPIEANKNQAGDGAEGLFLRSGSPQNVYLLPQRQNFHLERCPRPKQIYDHPTNEPDMIFHPAIASPDCESTASQMSLDQGLVTFDPFGFHDIRPETLVRWHRASFRRYLALEIRSTGRTTADRDRIARADPADEHGEFALRCAAHPRRTAQARV